MTGTSKRKGDRAELGVQTLIRDLLGWPARRMLGAGRLDDIGDVSGCPDTTIQVCDWKDVLAAIRTKPRECEQQQARAGATFGATFVRLRGGEFRVVLTPEQWACYAREAQPVVAPPTLTDAAVTRLRSAEDDEGLTPIETEPVTLFRRNRRAQ